MLAGGGGVLGSSWDLRTERKVKVGRVEASSREGDPVDWQVGRLGYLPPSELLHLLWVAASAGCAPDGGDPESQSVALGMGEGVGLRTLLGPRRPAAPCPPPQGPLP